LSVQKFVAFYTDGGTRREVQAPSVKSGQNNLQRVISAVYLLVMMGLGSSDVSIQVFPLVQFIRNVIAMRGGTTTLPGPILEGLA
jgi:hypothetical protein